MQQEQARKAGRGTSPRKKRPSGARPRKKPSAVRPIGGFTSLKAELSILIIISTAITFLMSWFLLQYGVSGWIAMPLTLAAALEVGQLARSFNAMAEELEHADQMRRDLIANVSHELRTPVSALQAQVENMADGVIEPTPANLDGLLSQTMRLTDLIAFLLDMSRVEAGAASLEITEFNVKDFIDDVVKPLEIADGGHGHMISLDVPPNITMEGDQDRLRQLYTNIVSNAIKHSADGTAVLVEVHEDRVHDTIVSNIINFGSQISQEARSDIFRRYVKGQGSRPGTGSGGTGLGLSIARWAAQLHSGTVRVVDDSRGANFEITLPKHHNIPLVDEQL